ncbi:MAG: hypothetical protein OXF04_06620 [bacterium]|nr:hypothetical protein [bacterium]
MKHSMRIERGRWFIDEDLLGLGLTLERAGIDVVYPGHPGFPGIPRRTSDEDWIRIAGQNGWPAFTHDNRILREKSTAGLLRNSPTVVFFLLGRDESIWHYVRMVAKHWDVVAAKLRDAERGDKRHHTINLRRVAAVQV